MRNYFFRAKNEFTSWVTLCVLLSLVIIFLGLNSYLLNETQKNIHYYENLALSYEGQLQARPDIIELPAQRYMASWYDYGLPGEPEYSKTHATAATWITDYQRGDCLLVERIDTDKGGGVIVRVNDWGPAKYGMAIDLSSYAFQKLAPLSLGIVEVSIEKLEGKCN